MRESYINFLVLIKRYITGKFKTIRSLYRRPFPNYYALILLFFILFYFILFYFILFYFILFYFINLLLFNSILIFNKINIVTRIL